VAGSSNLPTPTRLLRSISSTKRQTNTNLLSTVNKFVNTPTTEFFHELSCQQQSVGLSDRAFAKKLGISNAYLSYLRRGIRHLKPDLLGKILAIFLN
jgi:hypothetical protein